MPGTPSLKMLFPLWALTGLKFLKPELVNFQIFVNKEELTTLTLFYDAYYDFGIAGVLLLSCVLGALAWYLMGLLKKMRNPVGYLFYARSPCILRCRFLPPGSAIPPPGSGLC